MTETVSVFLEWLEKRNKASAITKGDPRVEGNGE